MMCAKSALKSNPSSRDGGEKIVTVNRRAYHEYFIEDEVEAGIQLTGTEIKSIRDGRMNIRDAFARVENGEMWLYGMHISPYGQAGSYFQHDPLRRRKLLLHRKQIEYMADKAEAKGYALIPLRLALRKGRAKVDIGIAKGKRDYDKRQSMAERDAKRQIDQALRQRG
jgi:SsrA-binding protein